jgi:hypothetical protein
MDNKLIAENLGAVKQELMRAVQAGPASPSVIESARNAITFLDTTYLWTNLVGQMLEMQSPDAVEQKVEEALVTGNVIQGDFTPKG